MNILSNPSENIKRTLLPECRLYAPVKRLPPYAQRIISILGNPALLRRYSGCTGTRATILITDDWDWIGLHPHHLGIVMPVDDAPDAFVWGFLRGHEPILLEQHLADNRQLAGLVATALIRDGVGSVLAMGNENQTRYRGRT